MPVIAALKRVRENWVVPPGLSSFFPLFPALKRWAKLVRPSGAGSRCATQNQALDRPFPQPVQVLPVPALAARPSCARLGRARAAVPTQPWTGQSPVPTRVIWDSWRWRGLRGLGLIQLGGKLLGLLVGELELTF